MSQNVSKSSAHGFCDAIFSSSPITFDKENTNSVNKRERTCNNRQQEVAQSQDENKYFKCDKRTLMLDNEVSGCLKNISTPSGKCLPRAKSVNMLHKHQTLFPGIASEEKHKTPLKVKSTASSSCDKTLVGQFCTPKQYKLHSAVSNTKLDLLPLSRTPVKHYFSDHILSQATPDCFSSVRVETPYKSLDVGIEDQTIYEGENSNLTVGIRIRPLNAKELSEAKITSVIVVDGPNIVVNCESTQHSFVYDHCFISYPNSITPNHNSQETVFRSMVAPLVQNAFEGYNVCLFAYGQTGSGKSYSMMGQESPQINFMSIDEAAGIIPRFCQEIFMIMSRNTQNKTTVEISYFEIYNEKIHDLLTNVNNGAKRAPLKVREHPVFGPYIVDLSQHCVQSYKDVQTWLKVGNSQRATAATGMNEKSSRSHSIFSIILTQTQIDGKLDNKPVDASRRSKINLVDLAGSERLSHTCASGDRLKEGVSINKSLLTLGKVIASLAENTNNRKRGFVPYRESVLTWLLKESLGGNSRTAMLGTVSPANIHIEETLATLRYACQARAIVNRVRINEDPHEKLIRELKAEVLRLRGVREGYEKQLGVCPRRLLDFTEPASQNQDEVKKMQQEIDSLKNQLKKTEEQLSATQMNWLEKFQEAEEKKDSELKYLRRCGIAIEIDFHEKDKQPCLVNLTADPMLSGTLLYLIPPGLVRIGKNCKTSVSSKALDIILDGPLVKPLHCTIRNDKGKLVLKSEMDADTYVNGQVVSGKVILKHGDRLVIGGNHYFKVSNPHDKNSNIQICAQTVDYEFAHQEILKMQEEKLKKELEESKQKAIKELENAKREMEMQFGNQKISYERKIEEQKFALQQINERQKELEKEKELLTTELETNNRIKEIQQIQKEVNITPYKTNFLEELESILNEKTAEAEFALKMKANEDTINEGGISLHEMQILVREATERCREVGLSYEFDQQQVIAGKSLQPVVRIRNKDRMKETLWQPMRFLDWVHRLRDYDIEDSLKELCTSDETWETYEDTEVFEDSLNSSRISINMTPVKKQLNESLHQLSLDASAIEFTMNNEVSESCSKKEETANACLVQMEVAANTLRTLYKENKRVLAVTESLNQMQSIIESLKSMLETIDLSECENESSNSTQSFNNTVVENLADSSVTLSTECVGMVAQAKSNLRNTADSTKNIQKSVRFTDKE